VKSFTAHLGKKNAHEFRVLIYWKLVTTTIYFFLSFPWYLNEKINPRKSQSKQKTA